MSFVKVTNHKFPIHGWYKSNLDFAQKAVDMNWDFILLVDGPEGSGKTIKAAETCAYLSYNPRTNKTNFSVKNFVWTPEQFERLVAKAPPRTAILWDEFVLGGMSGDAVTKVQKTIVKHFTLIRKKRLYIILVIPYIFLLSQYFVARTRALIHVYSPDGIRRGFFKFYNYQQKRDLWYFNKKGWSYSSKFPCAFTGYTRVKNLAQLGVDEEEYEKRKDEAMASLSKEDVKEKKDIYRNRFFRCLEYIKENTKLTWKELPTALDLELTPSTIKSMYSKYKVEMAHEREHQKAQNKLKLEMPK